jgi:hypothetical protein
VKHSSSRELFAYWTARRGARPAPERGDIDPAAIRHSLSDVFMLAADFVEEQRFRLAGTRVCGLFGRELKGEAFGSLWNEASRDHLRGLLAVVTEESTGIVAGAIGHNAEGGAVDLELLLLPLARQGLARIRAIGVLAATDLPFWLGTRPIKELELGTVRHVGNGLERPDPKRFVAALRGEGRMRRGFMVYQGGIMEPPSEKAG